MIRSIVRTRNTRIGRMFRRIKPAGPEVVLSDVQFETELKKEIYRSDRRAFARDLGLVRLKMDAISNEFFVSGNFTTMLDRLRVSDTIGWYQGDLSILLPESDREGTLKVANEVTDLLAAGGVRVEANVSTYPFDDELVSLAEEVRALSSEASSYSNDDDDDDDALTGGRRDKRHRDIPAAKSKAFGVKKNHGDDHRLSLIHI